MALTQNLAQFRANVRRFTDTGGVNALARHPDADLSEYVNRAFGSLHRILTQALPDQRILSSAPITTASSVSLYPLPADFDHLISIDLVANGAKRWLQAYEMSERPQLTDPSVSSQGIPFTYRLRASNIEFLPVPTSTYVSTLWYVPTPQQLTDDVTLYDVINRVDDYVIAYASRFVAVKDKNTELVGLCVSLMTEMKEDLQTLARSRDKNSPTRIVDEMQANRWGRRRWGR